MTQNMHSLNYNNNNGTYDASKVREGSKVRTIWTVTLTVCGLCAKSRIMVAHTIDHNNNNDAYDASKVREGFESFRL